MINRITAFVALVILATALSASAAEPGRITTTMGAGPAVMLWAETSGGDTQRGSQAALQGWLRVGYGLSERLVLEGVVEETVFRLAYDQNYSDGSSESTSAIWVNGFYGLGLTRYSSRFVETTYITGAIGWGTLSVPFDYSTYRNYAGPALSGRAGYTFPDDWGIEIGTAVMSLSADNKGGGDMLLVNVGATLFRKF